MASVPQHHHVTTGSWSWHNRTLRTSGTFGRRALAGVHAASHHANNTVPRLPTPDSRTSASTLAVPPPADASRQCSIDVGNLRVHEMPTPHCRRSIPRGWSRFCRSGKPLNQIGLG
jgi:hypothetical protein